LEEKLSNHIDFTKKLLSYSVFGAAAALTASPAQGAIIANLTPQPFDVSTGTFAFINFDGAGGNEFEINGSQAGSFTSVNLYRNVGTFLHFEDGNAANGGGNQDPNALPFGFLLGPGGAFNNEGNSDTIANAFSGVATTTGGNFPNFVGQLRYLGTQFNLGGNTHFGWIALRLNANLRSGTVECYAYESTPGQGISTGDTGGGACGGGGAVPEPSSLALMAAGAAGLFALRRRKSA
jgi:hypothetical protein